MRFKNYLTENADIDILHKECSTFIQEWKSVGLKNGLLRGIKDSSITCKKVDASKYRLPRDISLSNSKFVDKLYKETIGTSLRSSAVFCTHLEQLAKYYGTVYYAVPVGNYKLYVNPIVRDLFTDVFAWTDKPLFCQPGAILDPVKILMNTMGEDGIHVSKDKLSAKIKSTATRALLPFLLTRDEKDRMVRISQEYLTPDNIIYEAFNLFGMLGRKSKKSKNSDAQFGKKLSSEEAYRLFWKYAYENLEDKVSEIIKKTRQMSLSETLNYKENEVMLICKEYYLVSTNVLTEI